MSVNSKMTAVADEIRTLSGTSEKLGLVEMATNLGEANDEVDAQVELLAQAVAALEGKAGGGGAGNDAVLFGTYVFKTNPESPNISTEITFGSGQVKTYFPNFGGDKVFGDVSKIIFTEQSVEFIPSDSELKKKFCIFGVLDDYAWHFNNGFLADGWETIITFTEPISFSQDDYNAIASMISNFSNPYDDGYNYGYNDCESNMSGFNYDTLYVDNQTGFSIFLNGANTFEGIILKPSFYINMLAFCSAEEFASMYAYVVDMFDGTIVDSLDILYSEITTNEDSAYIGLIELDYDTTQYSIVFTTEPLE